MSLLALLLAASPALAMGGTAEPPSTKGAEVRSSAKSEIPVPSIDDMLNRSPGEIFGETERKLDKAKRTQPQSTKSVDQIVTEKLTGGDGIKIAPIDRRSASGSTEQEARDVAAYQAKLAEEQTTADSGYTAWPLLMAVLGGFLLAAMGWVLRRRFMIAGKGKAS